MEQRNDSKLIRVDVYSGLNQFEEKAYFTAPVYQVGDRRMSIPPHETGWPTLKEANAEAEQIRSEQNNG